MRPKQWLADNGHIADPTQRGRLSRDHIALIEDAVRNGAQIDGYAVSTAQPKTEAEKTAPKVEKVATSSDRVADVPDVLRDESVWKAHTYDDGKAVPVGMRTVCNTCGNSLNYCPCRTPTVWIDHERAGMVTFTLRK